LGPSIAEGVHLPWRRHRDTRLLKRIGALIADEKPPQNSGIIDRHLRQSDASVTEI
jgi:hypothetical protein